MRSAAALLLSATVLAVPACGARAERSAPPAAPRVGWRALGAWSGGGSAQTDSFTSDSGTLRVRWTATSAAGDRAGAPLPFRVTAHSAISGRPLQEVVSAPTSANGVAYVQQDPHTFYMVVESRDVKWTVAVEEAVAYDVHDVREIMR